MTTRQQLSVISPADVISIAVKNGNTDIDTLKGLFEIQDMYEGRQARKAFLQAKTAFMAEMPELYKTAKAHNSMYIPLPDIMSAIKPGLAKNNLSISWRTEQDGDLIKVTCILSHVDGYSETNTMYAPPDSSGSKNSIQALGSSQSYLMRYTLSGLLAIAAAAPHDNDGNFSEGPITSGLRDELQNKLADAKIDVAKFCSAFSINSLADLPKDRYGEALAMIEAKKSRGAK